MIAVENIPELHPKVQPDPSLTIKSTELVHPIEKFSNSVTSSHSSNSLYLEDGKESIKSLPKDQPISELNRDLS